MMLMASVAPPSIRTFRYWWSSLIIRLQIFIDKAVQIAGPLYIILAVTLISCIIYLFFTTILPSIHNLNSFKGAAHILVSLWLIFNVFFNYFYCVRTDPGSPPDYTDVELDPMTMTSRQDASENGSIRWCKSCRKMKPPLTHHCHICRRCILKMDHHCPWMHNCIGFFNYRFFFVFLFYMWIGCAYTAYMASIPLRASFKDDEEENVQVLFTFVLALAVFFSLTGLFGFHVYLVLSAQTTIDFYAYRRRRRQARREAKLNGEKQDVIQYVNPYDMGRLQNLRSLFDRGGSYWWLLMLLPHKLPPRGDGMHHPNKNADMQMNSLLATLARTSDDDEDFSS